MGREDGHIVLTGGAGLVGQNLVIRLLERGCQRITVIDKSAPNLAILKRLHPVVEAICCTLQRPGEWQRAIATADVLVMLHAQIGGVHREDFVANNIDATRNVLESLAGNSGCYLVHVSSSVVNSKADDWYSSTKRQQEVLVLQAGNPLCVLRPTLMFGWFDRKHFGWLSRFMRRSPVFPIPGDGNYLRQPLYAGDFCNLIVACIEQRISSRCFDISGKQKVAYRELIGAIRTVIGSRTLLLRIPVPLFRLLLRVYALFDRDPPFTASQLDALVIDEVFDDTDWETDFGVHATPLDEALRATFADPVYSAIRLQF